MKNAKTWSITVAVLCGIFIFIHTLLRQWNGDDLNYGFIVDANMNSDAPIASDLRPITSVTDVIQSQIYHYQHVNGRMPVHIIVQLFDGLLGHTAFAIANALIFVIFLLLMVRMATRDNPLHHPWSCLLIAITLFTLFPSTQSGTHSMPWAGISMSVNYLWSGALFLSFILLFTSHAPYSRTRFYLTLLLSLLTGWSNEAFAVPLSGAIFCFIIYHLRHHSSLSFKQIYMAVALWIGTALVVFAPGTIERAVNNNSASSLTHVLATALQCYTGVIFIWLFLITSIILMICRRRILSDFIHQSAMLLIIWVIAIFFSIYAHTHAHSLIAIELLSLILLWRLLSSVITKTLKPRTPLLALTLALFTVFETLVCRGDYYAHQSYQQMLQLYRTSPDGISYLPDAPFTPFSAHYNNYLSPAHYTAPFVMAKTQRFDTPPLALSQTDYTNIILRPDSFFSHAPRIPCNNLDIREGHHYYFARLDSANTATDNHTYVATFDSNSFLQGRSRIYKLYYNLLHNGRKQPKMLNSQIIFTRHGPLIMLRKINSSPAGITIAD